MTTKAETTSPPTASAPKPKPMLFAIMRNGHEVIRGAAKELQASVAAKDISKSQQEWEVLQQWQDLHMKMEEGPIGSSQPEASPVGFFRILDDQCDGVATKGGMFSQHEELSKVEADLSQAMASNDMAEIQKALVVFLQKNEEHLKHEESIMMPMVQKLSKEGHPMKKYMREDIFAAIPKDQYKFFITYAVDVLQRHSTPDQPRFRVFAHALFALATPEEWKEWNAWIKETVTPDTYASLETVL